MKTQGGKITGDYRTIGKIRENKGEKQILKIKKQNYRAKIKMFEVRWPDSSPQCFFAKAKTGVQNDRLKTTF